jgi:sugar phosphate isomerase/epimerase
MDTSKRILYSRRDFGMLVVAGLPLSLAMARRGDSTFNGVLIGAQTYSFRTISNAEDIIKAMQQIGLSEAELMSNHAEALAGAPPAPPGGGGRGRGEMTPEQQQAMRAATQARNEEMRKWRQSISMDRFKDVRKKFADAGVDVRFFCYNMNQNTTDDDIEYAFQVAKALGARAITTSTQVSVAKKVAPFADKHQMMVGYHGHSNLTDPNEFATPESFATAMSYSKYHGVNLDIGHFTAANFDAVAYIKEHHDRITNLHLKDRKKNQGDNVPWGQGDTPIKEVLRLLRDNRYDIPANIEFEYSGDPVVEVGKCVEYCKQALTVAPAAI